MAQTVQIHLEDDLDGGPADHTVSFALDGKDYEIDLSEEEAEEFTRVMAPYTAAARRVGGRRSTSRPVSPDREQLAAIRRWATENGYKVSDRGRIAKDIVEAYHAAH